MALEAVRPVEEQPALDAYSEVVTHVAERLLPSVVSLEFRAMGRAAGAGSAIVLTPDGLLVTSAHVVAQGRRGTAAFADGSRANFEVIGRDPLSDLAVLRASGGPGLAPAETGDADRLRVGQLVVAVGSPLGYAGSLSAGVVSGLGRSLVTRDGEHQRYVENVIQTDAALHPGNSGGALADGSARVVGVNTAVVGSWFGQGLGLAVPINATTQTILSELISKGKVRRAYLGVVGGVRPLPPRMAERINQRDGLEVTQVVAGSPAQRGGLRVEDIVVAVGEVPVRHAGDLQRLMNGEAIGRATTVTVVRGGALTELQLVPVELGRD